LLHGRLALYDVDDAEAFCGRILDDQLRAFGVRLRRHDTEDALAFLVSECWRLSVRYDPNVGQKFSTYARRQLRLRFVDFLRAKLGRTRWSQSDRGRVERPRRDLVSLDGLLDAGGGLDGGVGAGAVDTPFGCDPALGRLFAD
jgi:hypothetical protein